MSPHDYIVIIRLDFKDTQFSELDNQSNQMTKMPPNDDGKIKITTTVGSPLIREPNLELISSSLFDNNIRMTMEEENKTKYSNGLNENYNDTTRLDDHER